MNGLRAPAVKRPVQQVSWEQVVADGGRNAVCREGAWVRFAGLRQTRTTVAIYVAIESFTMMFHDISCERLC